MWLGSTACALPCRVTSQRSYVPIWSSSPPIFIRFSCVLRSPFNLCPTRVKGMQRGHPTRKTFTTPKNKRFEANGNVRALFGCPFVPQPILTTPHYRSILLLGPKFAKSLPSTIPTSGAQHATPPHSTARALECILLRFVFGGSRAVHGVRGLGG